MHVFVTKIRDFSILQRTLGSFPNGKLCCCALKNKIVPSENERAKITNSREATNDKGTAIGNRRTSMLVVFSSGHHWYCKTKKNDIWAQKAFFLIDLHTKNKLSINLQDASELKLEVKLRCLTFSVSCAITGELLHSATPRRPTGHARAWTEFCSCTQRPFFYV